MESAPSFVIFLSLVINIVDMFLPKDETAVEGILVSPLSSFYSILKRRLKTLEVVILKHKWF